MTATKADTQGQNNGAGALDHLGATAAGVIASFTAAVGALGFTGTGVGALVRNHPKWSALGLMFLALAISLSVGSILAERKSKRAQTVRPAARRLFQGAAVAFVVGIIFVISAATLTAGDKYQPSITVSFKNDDNALSLVGEVKASGLGARQHVSIAVFAVTGDTYDQKRPIYAADEGPSVDGNVDAMLSLPVRLGLYDRLMVEAWVGSRVPPSCNENIGREKADIACVSLPVPSGAGRPALIASVDGDGASRALTIKVNESSLSDAERVVISVTGTLAGKQGAIYSATVSSNALGIADASIRLPYPPSATDLCVAAMTVRTRDEVLPACPPQATDGTSWAVIGSAALPVTG